MKRFVEGLDRGQSRLFPERLEDYDNDENPVRVVDVFIDALDLVRKIGNRNNDLRKQATSRVNRSSHTACCKSRCFPTASREPVVMKFWLAIDRDEQLRRFKAREESPYRNHKITKEDWRNREEWDDYRLAARDMVDRTSTPHTPWTLVAANDKRCARVTVLQTVAMRLEEEL